jgi:putative ABC transport system ATP-binding protein
MKHEHLTQPSLCARGVSKRYPNGERWLQVVKPCTLDIAPGELTLIVGPSGSGKSTLLSLLSGLSRPDAGQVTALGTDLFGLSKAKLDAFRLSHCGFVFQGFNLFSALTALDNVILPLQYQGVAQAEARQRALAALEAVGLADRVQMWPAALSGGEKQRVAVARALVKQPELVFADEPTSALDSHNGQRVVDLLRRHAHQQQCTVLGVTHDPRLLAYADRVITLEDGAVMADERRATGQETGAHAGPQASHTPTEDEAAHTS